MQEYSIGRHYPAGAHGDEEREQVQTVIGWDIGGAHVKAAFVRAGRVLHVQQIPCPLWQGADRLLPVVAEMLTKIGTPDRHAVTMTAELADIFPDRQTGVVAIAEALAGAFPPGAVEFYAGRSGFVSPGQVVKNVSDIGSANWHASAAVAVTHGDGLFMDVGSTTTDIVALRSAKVCFHGYTDAERLACGELVYTGFTRSFVMALATRAPFRGGWTTIAAEFFASSADIYRVLGQLDEHADQMPTADGRAKTVDASRARLARMIGHDAEAATDAEWDALAAWFAEMQLRQIHDAALLVLSRTSLPRDAPLIAAGVGTPIVQTIAARLGRRCISFDERVGASNVAWASACAPAVAVALLAASCDRPEGQVRA